MKPVEVTAAASRDIGEAWVFRGRRAGRDNADRLAASIETAVGKIGGGEAVLTARDDIAPGLFFTRVGRHLVFARTTAGTVVVVGVFHERQDYESRLAWRLA